MSREWPPTPALRQPEAAPSRRLPLAEEPPTGPGRASVGGGGACGGGRGPSSPTSERFQLAMELEPTGGRALF